jgi:two-component system, OmpR family, response regulator
MSRSRYDEAAVRVLVVEDDPKVAKFLAKGLREESFVVDVAASGEQGEEMLTEAEYDVIVLDWLLPGKEGLAVCEGLRARGVSTPILMLTARDSLDDRVSGLTTGADDYLTKPFAFAELLARIRALLRRSRVARPVVLRVGDLTLDPGTRRVARGGVPITLTAKEYAILEVLMRNAGDVVSRTRLTERVWDEASDVLDNLVEVHVSRLRRKIDRGGVPLIHTVRGSGYWLGLPAPMVDE